MSGDVYSGWQGGISDPTLPTIDNQHQLTGTGLIRPSWA